MYIPCIFIVYYLCTKSAFVGTNKKLFCSPPLYPSQNSQNNDIQIQLTWIRGDHGDNKVLSVELNLYNSDFRGLVARVGLEVIPVSWVDTQH
jgi:hypothetical protein